MPAYLYVETVLQCIIQPFLVYPVIAVETIKNFIIVIAGSMGVFHRPESM